MSKVRRREKTEFIHFGSRCSNSRPWNDCKDSRVVDWWSVWQKSKLNCEVLHYTGMQRSSYSKLKLGFVPSMSHSPVLALPGTLQTWSSYLQNSRLKRTRLVQRSCRVRRDAEVSRPRVPRVLLEKSRLQPHGMQKVWNSFLLLVWSSLCGIQPEMSLWCSLVKKLGIKKPALKV